jgi:hypothetical protein
MCIVIGRYFHRIGIEPRKNWKKKAKFISQGDEDQILSHSLLLVKMRYEGYE